MVSDYQIQMDLGDASFQDGIKSLGSTDEDSACQLFEDALGHYKAALASLKWYEWGKRAAVKERIESVAGKLGEIYDGTSFLDDLQDEMMDLGVT